MGSSKTPHLQQEAIQLPLDGFTKPLESNGFCDPAFASNKGRPVHRWVPWIAGFSAEFVRGAITRYLQGKGTVLDPFAGVGTTLVEAILLGHNAIGFEINPYAALACRVKTNAYRIPWLSLEEELLHLREFYNEALNSAYVPRSSPPKGFRSREPFYSQAVLYKVLVIQDFIRRIADEQLMGCFQLAFASTMVRYSNYSYEPSLGRRVSAGKSPIEDYPVLDAVAGKLAEIIADIRWMQEQMPRTDVEARIYNDSFFECQSRIPPESADILITSPPYLNNYHYNRNTRPHLYWLGLIDDGGSLSRLENLNFGKFWQTVREAKPIRLDFKLPGTDLEERLELLRSLGAEKGVYGGSGWANYAACYFNDCLKFAKAAHYCLKKAGTALVVVGNSILQGVEIPTDLYLGKIAELAGLTLVDIHIPRATRVGNSIIASDVRAAKAKKGKRLYEAVVELRKE